MSPLDGDTIEKVKWSMREIECMTGFSQSQIRFYGDVFGLRISRSGNNKRTFTRKMRLIFLEIKRMKEEDQYTLKGIGKKLKEFIEANQF